jgi:hypothetical protein
MWVVGISGLRRHRRELDGIVARPGVEGAFYFPYQGWEREKIDEEFRWLARHVVGEQRIDELIDMVWHFDDVSNVSQLTGLLQG